MIVNKEEFLKSKRKYLKQLKEGVFIYPTDSIYGIGCDATNEEAVQKVRHLKKSNLQPFSIIAPSKEWVYENCVVGEKEKKYVEKLGSYVTINGEEHRFTLILKLKNENCIAKNVNRGKETVGIRIPNNWFSEVVKTLNFPVVTTSANVTGEDFMTSIDNLNQNIKKSVDLIIAEGERHGRPSTIINLAEPAPQIRAR